MILAIILIALLAGLLLFVGINLGRGITELVRRTPPPLSLPNVAMEKAVELLDLKPTDVVFDLGCGDGQLLHRLCQARPEAHFAGIDHDPTMIWRAKWRLRVYRSQLKLQRQDLLKTNLSSATKVVCYLNDSLMAQLEPRFDQQFESRKVRLVSADYPLPNRQPTKTVWVNKKARRGRVLYIYDY